MKAFDYDKLPQIRKDLEEFARKHGLRFTKLIMAEEIGALPQLFPEFDQPPLEEGEPDGVDVERTTPTE